jgi:hypothetical protein
MARDFEVEEGREVVRRTIVGGRPRAREKRKIRVPIGLETVLCRAAADTGFRAALLADRGAALDAAGVELLASERAVLDSVPEPVLAGMIGRIDVQRHGRGRFMRGVLAATFAATAVLGIAECNCAGGDRADWPEDLDVGAATMDVPDDTDPSRGISPDIPFLIDAPEPPSDGIRPDVIEIDVGEPMPAGILPDVE